MPAPRSIVQDIGLFVVLVIVADGVILPAVLSPASMSSALAIETFHLALAVQVMTTLYVGTFGAARTLTWLLLIAAWAGSEIIEFAGHMLLFGPPPIAGTSRSAAAVLWPLAALIVLALDVAVMHAATPRRHAALSFALLFAAAIVVALIERVPLSAFELAALPPPVSYRDVDVVPAWHALPFFAMLRAVPAKALGVAVALAALLLPMIWPWMRADRLRVGRTRWAWRIGWVAFVATVIGLGWLGTQSPDEPMIIAARILAGVYFTYLLVLPSALRRMADDVP